MTFSHTQALSDLLGASKVSSAEADTHQRRFDRWCVKHYRDWRGQTVTAPACVVSPTTTAEVQALIRYANQHAIAVIPYGLGSGVCGGIEPKGDDILLDMSRMNQVCDINPTDLLATFEAGKNGLEAEEAVAAHGLTIGHWPQSVAISTVGGWVSTRASGQFSTAYGNIEDIIYAMEVVLPNGEIVTLGKAPRAAAGPDLRHLIMGAEGIMGVVTKVTLSLRRQPEAREFSAFYCQSMAQGFEAQRQIVQADWRPPVMRQYDASEVTRLFPNYESDDSGLLLMVHEGPAGRVTAELDAVRAIADTVGLVEADSSVTEGWLDHRNHVPEWVDLLNMGVIADTIEVSSTWQQIDAVYNNTVAALQTVPSIALASAHSSHVYRSGINLYFTFACAPADAAEMEALYFEAWHKALTATAAAGGGIAHHHGSGRLRRQYLHHDLGEPGIELLKTLKHAIDPKGIMNPGNLLPEE